MVIFSWTDLSHSVALHALLVHVNLFPPEVGGKYRDKERCREIAEAAAEQLRKGKDWQDVKSLVETRLNKLKAHMAAICQHQDAVFAQTGRTTQTAV